MLRAPLHLRHRCLCAADIYAFAMEEVWNDVEGGGVVAFEPRVPADASLASHSVLGGPYGVPAMPVPPHMHAMGGVGAPRHDGLEPGIKRPRGRVSVVECRPAFAFADPGCWAAHRWTGLAPQPFVRVVHLQTIHACTITTEACNPISVLACSLWGARAKRRLRAVSSCSRSKSARISSHAQPDAGR